jgi:hypothetical protein
MGCCSCASTALAVVCGWLGESAGRKSDSPGLAGSADVIKENTASRGSETSAKSFE